MCFLFILGAPIEVDLEIGPLHRLAANTDREVCLPSRLHLDHNRRALRCGREETVLINSRRCSALVEPWLPFYLFDGDGVGYNLQID